MVDLCGVGGVWLDKVDLELFLVDLEQLELSIHIGGSQDPWWSCSTVDLSEFGALYLIFKTGALPNKIIIQR